MRIALVAVAASLALPIAVAAASGERDRNFELAQALVAHRCNKGSVRDTTMWMHGWRFNALFGDCGGGDGHDQHIWFFVGHRFVGADAPRSSAEIVALWRDDRRMGFLYVLYRASDALCCPTGGGTVVRFRWTGKRLVRLDPLPRRTATASRPGRYP